MATVTGVTKQRMEQIAGEIITGVQKQGSAIVFTKANGSTIQIPNAFPADHMRYAVGQILMTDRSANPATYLGGGTWVRWGKGRVPVSLDEADEAFDSVEETGGVKDVTLTVAQMPAHDHGGATTGESQGHTHTGYTSVDGNHAHNFLQNNGRSGMTGGGSATVADNTYYWTGTDGAGAHSHAVQTHGNNVGHTHGVYAQGGGGAHTNLQPYITCFMWKKTSDSNS